MSDFWSRMKYEKTDFSVKSYFADRMAIIALKHEHRLSNATLAKAFGLSRSTIQHICNLDPKGVSGYEDVHKEFKILGATEAYRLYVTREHQNRVSSFIKD